MLSLKITNDGKILKACPGEKLSELLKSEGYFLPSPCGGKGTCGKCLVSYNGKSVLACQTEIYQSGEVTLQNDDSELYVKQGIKESKAVFTDKAAFALDIGTTTVVLALLDGRGGVSEILSFKNPQASFGADVINRINAASNFGVEVLRRPLVAAIADGVLKLTYKYGLEKPDSLTVCGNTTMLHIFWGEDCSSLGYAPYSPIFIGERKGNAEKLGFPFEANVRSLAGISAFVGSDTVACLAAVPLPEKGKKSLLIDFGTNAEIALFDDSGYLTTSAAAGPCFEGANISCGMPATDGAITRFRYDYEEIILNFIGKYPPKGLCGTGLIDVVAELVKNDIIDKTGYLKEENGYLISENVVLTQKDVREFQLAKAAVRSGVETLLEIKNCSLSELSRVYLAGGFSSYITVENAAVCGLIPPELTDRCVSLANGALKGTLLLAENKADSSAIASRSTFVDLNAQEGFQEKFIEYIGF